MKWIIGIIAFLVLIFLIFNSSSSSSNTGDNIPAKTTINIDNSPDENIESDQLEEDINADSDPLEYKGYPCTVDCSGHEAGYEWAEEHGITQDDIDNYSGNSNSFMEGMQSYVDENE